MPVRCYTGRDIKLLYIPLSLYYICSCITHKTCLLSEKKKKKRDAVESFLDEMPTSTISAAVYLSWKCARESGRQTNEKSDSA